MESILSFINEKLELNKQSRIMTPEESKKATKVSKNTKWVAIEIETEDYWGKKIFNQRVVTTDTYAELKMNNRTRGGAKINYVNAVSPSCSSQSEAMGYIDTSHRYKRKSQINPKGADYVVWCIPSGKMNAAGKTYWDWNFWDVWKNAEIYMGYAGMGWSFLIGSPGSFKVGDTVFCVDNDTEKKLPGTITKISAISKCDIDDFRSVFRKEYASSCKRPRRMFGKDLDGLPWQKMSQIYSIKGVTKSSDL